MSEVFAFFYFQGHSLLCILDDFFSFDKEYLSIFASRVIIPWVYVDYLSLSLRRLPFCILSDCLFLWLGDYWLFLWSRGDCPSVWLGKIPCSMPGVTIFFHMNWLPFYPEMIAFFCVQQVIPFFVSKKTSLFGTLVVVLFVSGVITSFCAQSAGLYFYLDVITFFMLKRCLLYFFCRR